jgi:hypothetical protein
MDLKYVKKVQEWVEMDNKIIRNKESMKEAVDRKKDLEDEIMDYVESNKIDNLSLNISDGTIKFAKKVTTQTLSIKALKGLMEKYVTENNLDLNVDAVCNYVNTNLEKKSSLYMKRDIK